MRRYGGEGLRKAIHYVVLGRAMVFKLEEVEHIDRLRMLPVGLVEEN